MRKNFTVRKKSIQMDLIETKIKDVKILKPKVFSDSRGYFMETWREEFFRKNIFDKPLVQDNQSTIRTFSTYTTGSWLASDRKLL